MNIDASSAALQVVKIGNYGHGQSLINMNALKIIIIMTTIIVICLWFVMFVESISTKWNVFVRQKVFKSIISLL